MEAAKPISTTKSIADKIDDDLQKAYKDLLIKHLDDRTFKEEKIKGWMNNILIEAKEYFIKTYPDYDLFLLIFIYPKNVYFKSNCSSISLLNIDSSSSVNFSTDNLYAVLYYFYFKRYNLEYSLDEYEDEIIQNGHEILKKHLDERKFDYNKIGNYNLDINNDFNNFILEKEKKQIRCFTVNEIYQNPIKAKYFFKYLCHGKNIQTKIFHNFLNDGLICCHSLYFFK